jgi:hypothetical protein
MMIHDVVATACIDGLGQTNEVQIQVDVVAASARNQIHAIDARAERDKRCRTGCVDRDRAGRGCDRVVAF